MSSLIVDVHVSAEAPCQPLQEGDHEFNWPPISSTLICGPRSAVLVDTPITISQNNILVDWVTTLLQARNVILTAIYVTHGHPDHLLGLSIFERRFPGVKCIATKGTADLARTNLSMPAFERYLKGFPGQTVSHPIVPDALLTESPEILLDGHKLIPVPVGHTDTVDTTVLWVPDLKLVVAGDVVYGDVHQSMYAANTTAKRSEWLAALEKVLSLNPHSVVPGHKRAGGLDSVANVHNTIKYIRDIQRFIDEGVLEADDLYRRMVQLWPSRINKHVLQKSSAAAVAAMKAGRR